MNCFRDINMTNVGQVTSLIKIQTDSVISSRLFKQVCHLVFPSEQWDNLAKPVDQINFPCHFWITFHRSFRSISKSTLTSPKNILSWLSFIKSVSDCSCGSLMYIHFTIWTVLFIWIESIFLLNIIITGLAIVQRSVQFKPALRHWQWLVEYLSLEHPHCTSWSIA